MKYTTKFARDYLLSKREGENNIRDISFIREMRMHKYTGMPERIFARAVLEVYK